MAHEKEKAQYDEDCKKYGEKAYKLWEFDSSGSGYYIDINREPVWSPHVKYRRKEEPAFQPEYSLVVDTYNAMKSVANLIGKMVECSDHGEIWTEPQKLTKIIIDGNYIYQTNRVNNWKYIRICPETFKHPTITIGGFELPRPEMEAPEKGTKYWVFDSTSRLSQTTYIWSNDFLDKAWLKNGTVHLTEDRKNAWEDWWENTVIKGIIK